MPLTGKGLAFTGMLLLQVQHKTLEYLHSSYKCRMLQYITSLNSTFIFNKFTGHDGSVTNVGWSHDNNWLITSSDDKTARVWSLRLPDPVLTFSMVGNNFRSDKEGGLKPTKVT